MAYNEFTLVDVCKRFGLQLSRQDLFAGVEPLVVPGWLREMLDHGMPFAFGSEKARSEFIVAPVLLACGTYRANSKQAIAIYSGQRLDVDMARGLVGECDFIVSRNVPLPVMQAPIVTIVEAKKHDIEAGLGQCVAQMLGASLFNQQADSAIETIFGCVTTGEDWQFLKLEGSTICIDSRRYYIVDVGIILGVLQAILAVYE